MKAIRFTLLAACSLVGGLAVAGGPGSASQFGGPSVINMVPPFLRGFRCGVQAGLNVCVVPTANTCICRAGNTPVFNGAGQQIAVESWCIQRGNCP